jgi:transcriptional regulator with XRE-family HTH domain
VKRDKNKIPKVFGEVLRELRLSLELTQDKLAELAKTERSHISALERAEKAPSLSTIFVLADALGMSANELIKLVEEKLDALRD